MNMDFLKRLYMACSFGEHIFEKGLNLCELYHQLEDVEAADNALTDAIINANLPSDKSNRICETAGEANCAYELQGFVNGFQLAMKIFVGKVVD